MFSLFFNLAAVAGLSFRKFIVKLLLKLPFSFYLFFKILKEIHISFFLSSYPDFKNINSSILATILFAFYCFLHDKCQQLIPIIMAPSEYSCPLLQLSPFPGGLPFLGKSIQRVYLNSAVFLLYIVWNWINTLSEKG